MCLRYKSYENTVGKGEIAQNEQFLPFPQWETFCHFCRIWNCRLQINSFSFKGSEIFCLGKGWDEILIKSEEIFIKFFKYCYFNQQMSIKLSWFEGFSGGGGGASIREGTLIRRYMVFKKLCIWGLCFEGYPFTTQCWPTEGKSLLKTLWEKKKMLVTNIFFFSHNVFYPMKQL